MAVPRVSVIIPTYNRAHLVAEAVHSVLTQERVEVEVVVVDDGSTDNTTEVLADLVRSDPRVSAIQQDNAGPGAARNVGIAATTAPLVAFLDSDDHMIPADRLAIQADYLDEHPEVGWVIGTDDTVLVGEVEKPWILDARDAMPGPRWCVMTMLIHRHHLEAMGGFDPTFPTAEDTDLAARLVANGIPFGKIDAPYIHRRVTGDNLIYQAERDMSMLRIVRQYRQSQKARLDL